MKYHTSIGSVLFSLGISCVNISIFLCVGLSEMFMSTYFKQICDLTMLN